MRKIIKNSGICLILCNIVFSGKCGGRSFSSSNISNNFNGKREIVELIKRKDFSAEKLQQIYKENSFDAHDKFRLFCNIGMLLNERGLFKEKNISSKKEQVRKYKENIKELLRFMFEEGLNVDHIIHTIELEILKGKGYKEYRNTILIWDIALGRAGTQEFSRILLREFRANPFIPDRYGKNALHLLLLKGLPTQQDLIESVVAHVDIKAHINDKMVYGDTALHIECARRNLYGIKRLLSKGANLNIKNNKGQMPLDMLYMGKQERLAFLMSFGYLGEDQSRGSVISKEVYFNKEQLDYVAKIDNHIFNSDPWRIEQEIFRSGTYCQNRKIGPCF